MSSRKTSWTRTVVCQAVIPIRIDPKATDEEAVEAVKKLLRERPNSALTFDQLEFFAIPLEDEEEDFIDQISEFQKLLEREED